MISSMCVGDEHESCGTRGSMQHQNGKKFQCRCDCHIEAEIPEDEELAYIVRQLEESDEE